MIRVIFRVIFFSIFTFYTFPSYSQILINEFLASNSHINTDPDFGGYSDWIELYNAGNSAVNLKDFFLTDNFNNPGKWQITQDLVIEARGFALIWADGKDSALHASFKLSASGEQIALFTPQLSLVDSVSFALQKLDVSFGRKPDGTSDWGYFLTPTPGTSNASQLFTNFAKNVPEFSITGEIYASPVTVELSTLLGGVIRYTADGTEPDTASFLYTSPLSISSTTILRARIFKPGMIPGPVVTHSYFIDSEMLNRNLPVVSIATDPKNFWDPTVGIYVQNFKPDWEIPVNIELFENNHSDRAAFNEKAGIKVNGLYSWQLPQKMLGVYFDNDYGSSNLGYPIIFNKKRSSYKDFALRASGNDWSNTLFRDILGQDATMLNMTLDIMGFRPSVVYVNGQYMGIHNIREKVDEDFIAQNHQLPNGSFDMVENTDYAESGDLNAYNHLLELQAKDLSVQSNYDSITKVMDIENFTDLVITEMCDGNTSIDHNVMAWKPKEGGKWKWIVMDLDRGFFDLTGSLVNFYVNQKVWPFSRLMQNAGYKQYFGERLANHLYTSFNPIRIDSLINEHQRNIAAEIPSHVSRWLGTTSSYGNAMPSVDYWYKEVSKLRAYSQEKPYLLLNNLKSYGFSGEIAQVGVTSVPSNGGSILFQGMKVPEANWNGPYLNNSNVTLQAIANPGYRFKEWKVSSKHLLVSKGSLWKYLDDGSDLGSDWAVTVNDNGWKTGLATLGYGNGNEITTVDFGGNSANKYITTYFRQHFTVTSKDLHATSYVINLLLDDAAVVYLNGHELIRADLQSEGLNYKSLAIFTSTGALETSWSTWLVNGNNLTEGENVISAEVHQDAANSSDLSFDLEFIAWDDSSSTFGTTNAVSTFPVTNAIHLSAVFEPTGQCIIPAVISSDLVLGKACSPYLAQGDVRILPGATLTVEPGVEILMPPSANIFISGVLNAEGTEEEPVTFKSIPSPDPHSWGVLSFLNTPAPSHLTWVTIENSSVGPDPTREYAGISAFHGDLVLDHLTMTNIDGNPIVARYSDITLTNSVLHSRVVGDAINVKYGKARVENCEFQGNDEPDTDAVDYDDVINGIIRNCVIKNFRGFNSDGVDIGEEAQNIMIDSVQIYNIFDKGISVGQLSSVNVKNTIFINCTLGMGLKDLSEITVDHCTFYGCGTAIDCFEKNPGSAGGIATVTNSILSNSSVASYSADAQSSIDIQYSLSDNTLLPNFPSNIFSNPLFVNPTRFDFELKAGSPAINTGNDKGVTTSMGAAWHPVDNDPYVMICQLYINSLNLINPEFIALYNPSDKPVDLSGYQVNQGVTCRIPNGTILNSFDTLYLTENTQSPLWWNGKHHVIGWTEGKLSNSGESVQLADSFGLVIDHLKYENDGKWPEKAFTEGQVLCLNSADVDNHFAENWSAFTLDQVVDVTKLDSGLYLKVFPNPSSGMIHISAPGEQGEWVEVYSAMGSLLLRARLNESGQKTMDLSGFNQPLLMIKVKDKVKKVVIVK